MGRNPRGSFWGLVLVDLGSARRREMLDTGARRETVVLDPAKFETLTQRGALEECGAVLVGKSGLDSGAGVVCPVALAQREVVAEIAQNACSGAVLVGNSDRQRDIQASQAVWLSLGLGIVAEMPQER
ncbi:hypothetical protein B0H14DRAFT_2565988 [Mycena olivaceomarginata]|nr:hypothetical protein B0H14DRAFT_2565988 [Mycena olivaceomarginata]